jgi:ribose transport system substrate-binding protein
MREMCVQFRRALLASFVLAMLPAASATVARAQTDDLEKAKALIDEHLGAPKFVEPGKAFDAKACMAGKKILVIPVTSANPFAQDIVNAMQAAAKEVGFKLDEWNNQGKPEQWVQGVEAGLNQKYDMIDLMGGTDPALLAPQIKEARAAGVKVVVTHYYDYSLTPPVPLDNSVQVDYQLVGRMIADWIAIKSNKKANVLIIGSDEIVATPPYVKALRDELALQCGAGCKSSYINAPIPEWSSKIQPSVQAALNADPTINYIVPIYDSMTQFVFPALKITGRAGSVKIATFNGTPFIIDAIQKGDAEMDVGESVGWVGRGFVDADMRTLCNLDPVHHLLVPYHIFDADNAKEAGSPAQYDTGYGDVHVTGFRKLWGLQ